MPERLAADDFASIALELTKLEQRNMPPVKPMYEPEPGFTELDLVYQAPDYDPA